MNAPRHVRSLVIAGILLGFAAGPSASPGQGVLTTIEVEQLVQSAQPDDHAWLRDHFRSLADRYPAEAREIRTWPAGFWPVRADAWPPTGPRTFAAASRSSPRSRVRRSASSPRSTTGWPPAAAHAPNDSARFEAGEGAEVAWAHDRGIHDLATTAATASDHRALETYFLNAHVAPQISQEEAWAERAGRIRTNERVERLQFAADVPLLLNLRHAGTSSTPPRVDAHRPFLVERQH